MGGLGVGYFPGVGMDWPTIISSGGVGAAAGGVVSWLTARQIVTRQERGRSAVEARQQVRNLVDPVLTDVRQYGAHVKASVGRADEPIHMGDFSLCGSVLRASRGLPWWQRRLVRRRLQKLFGPNTVYLCEIYGKDCEDPVTPVTSAMLRAVAERRDPDGRPPQPDTGDFDAALRCPPGSDGVAKLVRSLERLACCR
jgi:hypothetical protein